MTLPFASLSVIVLASASVVAFAAEGHRVNAVHSSDWKKVVSNVKPLLSKALSEHGDGSIASNTKASQIIDTYIDLTRFVTSDEQLTVTNVLDSGTRIEDQNGVETFSSFLTLSCICADFKCNHPVAMDRYGAKDRDIPKYIDRTPLLFLDSHQKAHDCLSIFQLSPNEMILEKCDLDNTLTKKSDFLHVGNCSDGKIENLRIKQGNAIARPLNDSELLPNNMKRSPVDASEPISDFLEDFKVPKTTIEIEVDEEVKVRILGRDITVPIKFKKSVDITSYLEDAEKAMITSVVDNFGSIMLPDTFNETSPASDATLANYFRILLDYSMRRMRKPLQSTLPSPLLSGEPLYLDLIASRPETSALAEIISGTVLLAITAGTFGWFVGVMEKFELFLASCAFGAELAAFVLRWKAEVALEDWEEDMVLVDTITDSRTSEVPLVLGRDMNPVAVSITMARLSSSEDRATEMGFLIAGAVVAGISLFVAAYMGYKEKKSQEGSADKKKKSKEDSAVCQAGNVAEDTPQLREDPQSSVSGVASTSSTGTDGKQMLPPPIQSSEKAQSPERAASLTMAMDCSVKGNGAENNNAEFNA